MELLFVKNLKVLNLIALSNLHQKVSFGLLLLLQPFSNKIKFCSKNDTIFNRLLVFDEINAKYHVKSLI